MMACRALEVTLMVLVVATISPVWTSPPEDTANNDDCSLEKVDECTQYLERTDEPLGRQVIPNIMNNELQGLCSDWNDAKACMTKVNRTCSNYNSTYHGVHSHIQQRINEVNNGHHFLCQSELKSVYTEEARPCLERNETELVSLGNQCISEYTNMTWFLNRKNQENIYPYCKAAKGYMECIHLGVTSICGEETAMWTDAYHLSIWQAHLDNIECDPKAGVDAGAAVIITICAGAAIYCAVCVIASFVKDSPKVKKMCGKEKDGKGEYAMQVQSSEEKL